MDHVLGVKYVSRVFILVVALAGAGGGILFFDGRPRLDPDPDPDPDPVSVLGRFLAGPLMRLGRRTGWGFLSGFLGAFESGGRPLISR